MGRLFFICILAVTLLVALGKSDDDDNPEAIQEQDYFGVESPFSLSRNRRGSAGTRQRGKNHQRRRKTSPRPQYNYPRDSRYYSAEDEAGYAAILG